MTCPPTKPLSAGDAAALRRRAADVSDIPVRDRLRIESGFAAAYERAARILAGTLDPLHGGR